AAAAGTAGGTAVAPDPCTGASDARLVIAPQRNLVLTTREVNNMIRAIFGDAEANALINAQLFPFTKDVDLHFPPADGDELDLNNLASALSRQANHFGQ